MSNNPPVSSYSPGVLTLLPLYYVGWADSILSPSEVKLIHEQINELDFLSKSDRKLLCDWSDPGKPPSKKLFSEWSLLIRDAACRLPMASRRSLVDLGLEMAKQSATSDQILKFNQDSTRNALTSLEDALGVVSHQTHRSIFNNLPGDFSEDNQIPAPSFEVKKLTAILDDDYADIRNKVKQILSDPEFKLETIPVKEEYREKVLHWCKLLADQGLGATSYPTEYGGLDDMGNYAAIFETLGYHDLSLSIKFGVQFGLFGGSILWLGTKKHHEQYLKDTGTLQLPGCFAMTETGHGSNVRGLKTTATFDPKTDEIIVHSPDFDAGKEYIGNAMHSRMASVFAQLIVNGENHGVHAVLVPLRNEKHDLLPGRKVVDCGYKVGLNGVDNGRIWFDQVRVPRENLLNRFGDIDTNGNYSSPIENPSRRFFTMLGTLVGGRVCVPRAGLSAAKTALTIAIKYALKRRQFAPREGEPETILLDYATHQRRLMPLLAKAYALDFGLTYLTKRYTDRSEKDIREIETLAAGMKAYSTWFTTEAIQECREACGGKGYLAENRFADLKADSDIFTTFEGDNTVLMQLVAKGLLSEFKQEFHNEGYVAVIRFLSKQVTTTISELNPYTTRKADIEHLSDPDFQLGAFAYREQSLLYSLTQRMRALLKKKMDSFDAFLRCQTHMMELANAYIENIVIKQFVKAVNDCEDPEVKKVLKKLCDLYALSTIEKHKGWYLEQEYMQPVKTKAIRRLVNQLCQSVRNDSNALVDAFGIPTSCLRAPIIL